MARAQIIGLDGQTKVFESDAVEGLRSQLRGDLVQAGDPGYDGARTIWNAMIDRKPALIARCRGAADVQRSVAFARDHSLLLAVRGGGHNIAGSAVCDGGFMIDLTQMRDVRVDPGARRAYVGGGATLGDFDHEAQAFGLATPLGINSTTGVAGLTLGGGFGWLSRKYGLSVDNLVSADVVTADGKVLRVNETENSDLFWGIRGGGGNFGVVTNFEFQLHPVGPEVLSGLVVFPFDEAQTVLRKYGDFIHAMPDELNLWVILRKAPPLPFLPESVHGKEVVIFALFYAGDPEEGKRVVEPVFSFGNPVGQHVGVQPYAAWQQAFDPLLAPGARNYWKTHNFARLEDGAITTAIDQVGKLPSPQCEVFFGLVGGQASRIPVDATAWAHRDALLIMNVHGRWETAAEDERCIAWARDVYKAMEPYATGGAYVNFLTQDESARVTNAYGANHQRLVALKKKYDPGNLFRMNQNIRPD